MMSEELQDMLAGAGPYDQIKALKTDIEITEHRYFQNGIEWLVVG